MPRPLLVCALLLLIASLLLPLALPQRPDADATAIAIFDAAVEARFGRWLPLVAAAGLLDLRHAVWPNLAGGVLALWALDRLLRALQRSSATRRWRIRDLPTILIAAGLLVALAGWGWERSRGWWGELFLAPGMAAPLGPDGRPVVRFERFDRPPAPSGPGRSLEMVARLDERPLHISVARPLRAGDWTIRPHWYGAVIRLDGAPPLFFGETGTQFVTIAGEPVAASFDVATLRATIVPAREHEIELFAVLRARYAPGVSLRWLGLAVMAAAALVAAGRRVPGRGDSSQNG